MEEQKNSKEVKMGVVKNGENKEQSQKLSYEQLNQACMELSQQNQQMNQYIQKLHQQVREMQSFIQTKRMDYLFEVVRISSQERKDSEYPCFAKDFVEDCINEIQESLTIPKQTEEPKKEK